MNTISLNAYAKINLGLDVVRKREDNYHEVRMVMQTIRLYDKVIIEPIEKNEICIETNLSFLPTNENNLVYKAAELIKEKHNIKTGLSITLEKHIPVAAGLAGGSSDCAATLVGLNRLFKLNLSKQTLMEYGVTLGADVPYCIMRGTALSEGIGEILTPLPPVPDCYILIAKPSIHVSTKFVYENLKLNQLKKHPDIDGMVLAIHEKNLHKIAERMENVLETVTIPEYPVIGTLKDIMLNCNAINALMSGSGPTVFGLFEKKEDADRAYQQCREADPSNMVFLTTFFNK
ncbi:4-(cytidine 5'-diphospho)-2-C-methyl-D-erythritol kinase [Velocimicrobium porci]|uniref:4-diphosphocytidyl-2-C-methyl-D-erythritol kinase n=1 Tax=Velocimicrobium porci TaxID=2606634 RepID=A0A6L5XZC0_9FIRM|nr:4-(cytidine 5'-diphospho)-2-C-methyl-D-erythritol kinase [Velocimicrobium porci]MSS63273.1 4-(cytidine 5'-diphospho)-2-C-methyl-D-erythritol kinase [Velocimicrobium porci]